MYIYVNQVGSVRLHCSQYKIRNMRKLKFLSIGFAFLFSCVKEDNHVIDPNLITGSWRLELVTVNQIDGAEINDWISNSTILRIDENNSYYRNYVTGEWAINDKMLVLNPGEDMPNFYWEYEVLELLEDTLTMQIKLTEGQYCCDLDQFTEDEVLTFTEKYVRSE